jgi:hypothetical protein
VLVGVASSILENENDFIQIATFPWLVLIPSCKPNAWIDENEGLDKAQLN